MPSSMVGKGSDIAEWEWPESAGMEDLCLSS